MLTREYYTRAHAAGRLRVEGHAHIGLDTPLRVGMCIRHLIHRHEPPVLAGAVQVRCGAFCDLDGEGHACRLSEMMVQHLACLVAVCVGAKRVCQGSQAAGFCRPHSCKTASQGGQPATICR